MTSFTSRYYLAQEQEQALGPLRRRGNCLLRSIRYNRCWYPTILLYNIVLFHTNRMFPVFYYTRPNSPSQN